MDVRPVDFNEDVKDLSRLIFTPNPDPDTFWGSPPGEVVKTNFVQESPSSVGYTSDPVFALVLPHEETKRLIKVRTHKVPEMQIMEKEYRFIEDRLILMCEQFRDTKFCELIKYRCWLRHRTYLDPLTWAVMKHEWCFQESTDFGYPDRDVHGYIEVKVENATAQPPDEIIKAVRKKLKSDASTLELMCPRVLACFWTYRRPTVLRSSSKSGPVLDHCYFSPESEYWVLSDELPDDIHSYHEGQTSNTKIMEYLKRHEDVHYNTLRPARQNNVEIDMESYHTMLQKTFPRDASDERLKLMFPRYYESLAYLKKSFELIAQLKQAYLPDLIKTHKGKYAVLFENYDPPIIKTTRAEAQELANNSYSEGKLGHVVHITRLSLASGTEDGETLILCGNQHFRTTADRITIPGWFELDQDPTPVSLTLVVDTGCPIDYLLCERDIRTRSLSPTTANLIALGDPTDPANSLQTNFPMNPPQIRHNSADPQSLTKESVLGLPVLRTLRLVIDGDVATLEQRTPQAPTPTGPATP